MAAPSCAFNCTELVLVRSEVINCEYIDTFSQWRSGLQLLLQRVKWIPQWRLCNFYPLWSNRMVRCPEAQTVQTEKIKCLNVILELFLLSTFSFTLSPPPALPSPEWNTTVPLTYCLKYKFLLQPNCSEHVVKQLSLNVLIISNWHRKGKRGKLNSISMPSLFISASVLPFLDLFRPRSFQSPFHSVPAALRPPPFLPRSSFILLFTAIICSVCSLFSPLSLTMYCCHFSANDRN